MDIRTWRRRLAGAATVSALVGAALVAVATPAGAFAFSVNGKLQIKGAGSVYADSEGSAAIATLPGALNTPVSFSVRVVNKGTTSAQFQIRLLGSGLADEVWPSAIKLLSGSVDVTDLASSDSGWISHLIKPGKYELLTLSITLLKVPLPHDPSGSAAAALAIMGPEDPYMHFQPAISAAHGYVQFKQSTGTSGDDMFVTTPGQSTILAPSNGNGSFSASTPVSPTQHGTFTVKLQNDQTTPRQLSLDFYEVGIAEGDTCGSVVAKVGSAVITPTYTTPLLAKGKSVTITFTTTRLASCNEFVFALYTPTTYPDTGPFADLVTGRAS